MSSRRPIEVAIVGGGAASIAAAFELSRPEHEGKYHVTVYQMGWRLGGKTASSRGPADRIEEHGLHVWHGFYENAFRLLRECYAELDRDPRTERFASWRDAFFVDPKAATVEHSTAGEHRPWIIEYPRAAGEPGDPFDRANPFCVTSYLVQAAKLVRSLLKSTQPGPAASGEPTEAAEPEQLLPSLARLLRYGRLSTLADLITGAELLEAALLRLAAGRSSVLTELVSRMIDGGRRQVAAMISDDPELRRLWELIDLTLTCMRGVLRSDLVTDPRGFDAIEDYDLREWLELNGASAAARDSAIVDSLYDLSFSYEDGDPNRPRLAAGQALRTATRMFLSYRGDFLYKMRAGMGEVVIAPFYQVLERRGVSFQFFHRLENVRLATENLAEGERPYVEALEFEVQARVKQGAAYEALIDVDGVSCWRSEPDWEQLVNGARLRAAGRDFESHWDGGAKPRRMKTLRVVDDFDFVVLGLSIGAIPHTCREIIARDERWRAMVGNVKTVATQALQLWLREDMAQLGWFEDRTTLNRFGDDFSAWVDMSHLLAEEGWRQTPRALAYLCGALATPEEAPDRSDDTYPRRARAQVRRNVERFLNQEAGRLWPGALDPNGVFRWELLAGLDDRRAVRTKRKGNEPLLDAQYWRANVNPSDRYVLSLPGSHRHRISPLDNTYDNLTIAGDWTDCGFNVGCIESAVMSGRLAAHAISDSPPLAEIVGYDHP